MHHVPGSDDAAQEPGNVPAPPEAPEQGSPRFDPQTGAALPTEAAPKFDAQTGERLPEPDETQNPDSVRNRVKRTARERVNPATPLSSALGQVVTETGPEFNEYSGNPEGDARDPEAHAVAERAYELARAGLGRVALGEHPVDVAADELGVE